MASQHVTTTAPSATGAAAPLAAPGVVPPVLRYGKSFGIGAAFAVAWTPCIGPILGAVLTLAASSGTVLQGTWLLAAWSLGLGVPFLLAGLMLGQAMTAIRKVRPLMPVLEIAGGLLVIFIGALVFLGEFTMFNAYFTGTVNTVTGAEDGLTGIDVYGPFGFTVAFAAGVIAFLSPCCLPLVPAYLMHLAGVSADAGPSGNARGVTFRHAVAFVLGFSVLFVGLGAAAGTIGYAIRDNMSTVEKVAGALLIVMGLNLLGILKIPWLYRTYQFDFPTSSTTEAPVEHS
jgi:cytochrome c biogenesis protein CcdA